MALRSSDRFPSPLTTLADSRSMRRFVFASFMGHIALFAFMLFSPSFLPEGRYLTSVIDVRMVSLASQPAARQATAPKEAAPQETPAVAEPAPQPSDPLPAPVAQPQPPVSEKPEIAEEAPVSIAPKPKVYQEKTSLKHKTIKPKQTVKPPAPSVEKQAGARSDQVTRAIAKLKKNLPTPPPGSPAKPGAPVGGGDAGPGASGAGWPGGSAAGELIDVYKAEIAFQIQQNWAFSDQLTGGKKDLSAVIVLKILPSGQIGDTWFEKHSGNSFLDDSAFRAVQKSNPLPPLPKGYFRSFYVVGLIFTPEGIQ